MYSAHALGASFAYIIYFSFLVSPVESRDTCVRSACEVTLFHYEDAGIPRELARLGAKQAVWGHAKKIEPGLRAYQQARASGVPLPLSRHAYMARVNTKVSSDYVKSPTDGSSETDIVEANDTQSGYNVSKFLVIGSAVVLACSLDQGLLPKALILSLARKFGTIGKRM